MKKKPVIRKSQTGGEERELRCQDTKTIWQRAQSGTGLNTLGNKTQVSPISNQLMWRKKEQTVSKYKNISRKGMAFKIKQEVGKNIQCIF